VKEGGWIFISFTVTWNLCNNKHKSCNAIISYLIHDFVVALSLIANGG